MGVLCKVRILLSIVKVGRRWGLQGRPLELPPRARSMASRRE